MDLVIWTYIVGGATVFGLIVAVFSVWNGRMTRRKLRQVIEPGDRRTKELIERMDRRHTKSLQRMDSRMQEMDRRHTELLLSEVVRWVPRLDGGGWAPSPRNESPASATMFPLP